MEELPIYNWWQISDGLIDFVKKDKNTKVPEKILVDFCEKLQQDFFDLYGISDDFKMLFETEKEILALEVDLALTKNRALKTKIMLLQQKAEAFKKHKRKGENYKVKSYLDKFMGQILDPKKITVVEFYSYLELYKEENGKN